MYPGLEIPADIDIYSSSMMATGKTEGMVKFTAPNHPGLHHLRYFLLDDSEAAVSAAVRAPNYIFLCPHAFDVTVVFQPSVWP